MKITVNKNAPKDLAVNGKPLEAGKEYDLNPAEARAVVRGGYAVAQDETPSEAAAPAVEKKPRPKSRATARRKGAKK